MLSVFTREGEHGQFCRIEAHMTTYAYIVRVQKVARPRSARRLKDWHTVLVILLNHTVRCVVVKGASSAAVERAVRGAVLQQQHIE